LLRGDVFVAVVFVTYYLPPVRSFQVQWLVLASLVFHSYGQPELLPLLAIAVLGSLIIHADRAFRQLDAEEAASAVRANADRIRQLIGNLEQRGARVLLLEVPYMGRIEETRSVKATKAIIHAAFPEQDRWLPVALNRDELRWADGVHLDERSALIVSQAIDDALKALLSSTSTAR
jgi:hypothetical protein